MFEVNDNFWELNKEKYLFINDRVYIHQSPVDNKFICEMNQENTKKVYENSSLISINDDAVYLLKKIDGTKNIDEIVKMISKEKSISYENVKKIFISFVKKIIEYSEGYLSIRDSYSTSKNVEITGSKVQILCLTTLIFLDHYDLTVQEFLPL